MKTHTHSNYPIPSKLNTILTLSITGVCLSLLIIGSKINLGWSFALIALLFGLMMIPVYSLLHESEHYILHENKTSNYILGYLLSILFITPKTFYQQCHLGHHRRNRTDFEMFDLHYSHQSRFKRTLYLHIGRLGIQWLLLPFSVIVFILFPKAMTASVFRQDLMTEGMLSGLDKKTVPMIRWESLGVGLFHTALIFGLDLAWQNYLIMYLVHGFIWSSQNYVNHAHSERDILHGAHNHKLPGWIQAFYLNFNLHRAHHEHPKVPWIYLEKLIDKDDPNRISYFRAYFRLWKGTKLTTDPPPVSLDQLRNRATYQKPISINED